MFWTLKRSIFSWHVSHGTGKETWPKAEGIRPWDRPARYFVPISWFSIYHTSNTSQNAVFQPKRAILMKNKMTAGAWYAKILIPTTNLFHLFRTQIHVSLFGSFFLILLIIPCSGGHLGFNNTTLCNALATKDTAPWYGKGRYTHMH